MTSQFRVTCSSSVITTRRVGGAAASPESPVRRRRGRPAGPGGPAECRPGAPPLPPGALRDYALTLLAARRPPLKRVAIASFSESSPAPLPKALAMA